MELELLKKAGMLYTGDKVPCWACKHAVPRQEGGVYERGCEWSIDRRPVPGWNAEKKLYHESTVRKIYTYKINECPKFERGG